MTVALVEPVPQADGALEPVPEHPVWTAPQLDAAIRQHPGALIGDCFPLRHQFAPGVYAREITMPAGYFVVGRKHRTAHFNILSAGRVTFFADGKAVKTVTAPYTFLSEAGMQKVLYIHAETVWTTIHPTDETDLARLDALLIDPDDPLDTQAALAAERVP